MATLSSILAWRNPMDRGAWGATVHGVAESAATEQLHFHLYIYIYALCVCVDFIFISPVKFSRSVMSDSLRPHELQHARPPCPSPTPGAHSNSSSLSQ